MSKFSKRPSNVLAPIKSFEALGATYEGGVGYARDPKSELFLLAVTNMVSEGTFYEKAEDRDKRFRDLIRKVAQDDPSWIVRFVPYLRDKMNMRSASVVMAAEFVKVMLETDNPTKAPLRQVISSALVRADEPAEMLAYWHSRYGRKEPQPVKRGVADAVTRLYNERAALKYDGTSGVWRMGDVIDRVHPEPKADWQRNLFKYLIDKRHNREDLSTEGLPMIEARKGLEAMSREDFRAGFSREGFLDAAGVTWEWASSRYGPLDATFWQSLIPQMGYMALLRNLRNFDEAKVSDEVKAQVVAKLSDPEQVARSRQLPLRFYSAWNHARGLSWGGAIESALNLSVGNVPSLPGKTLVLVDVSGSMGTGSTFSNRGAAQRWELASLFGAALALRAEKADLFAYDTDSHRIGFHSGDSVLRTIDAIRPHVGGGTDTLGVLLRRYADQKPDRIVILTDEQAWSGQRLSWSRTAVADQGEIAKVTVPIYTFNLAGYERGHLPSGEQNRYTFGGLTDHGFAAIELLEKGYSQEWPF